MSEVEKKQMEIIEAIISRKMRPLYWIHGGTSLAILSIFLSISLPISNQILKLSIDVENKIDSEEAYRNFMTKGLYLTILKSKNEADMEAIKNHDQAEFIYMKLNNTVSERLDLITRSANEVR
jgi:hypothetical protein